MSTSDQHGGAPLTRKQLREARLTGATAVITQEQAQEARAAQQERERADTAPAPGSGESASPSPSTLDAADVSSRERAATPASPPSAPADGTAAEPGEEGTKRPLTRRAVRERIRTASVPVVDPDGSSSPAAPADAGEQPAAFVLPSSPVTAGGPEGVDADAEEQIENVDAAPPVSAFLSWSEEPAPAVESTSVFEAVRHRDARAGAAPVSSEPMPAPAPTRDDVASGRDEETSVLPPAPAEPAPPADSSSSSLFPASPLFPAPAAPVADPVFPREERTNANADRVPPSEEPSSSGAERVPPRPERIPPVEEPTASAAEPQGRPSSASIVTEGFGAAVLDAEENTGETTSAPRSFDDLLASDSTGSQHAAPSALIFQQPGGVPSLSGPVASTGEILVTGSYELPEGLGSQGHAKGTADGKEVDALLIDGELPPASSPTPIAASAAISTIKPAGEVIRPAEPEKGNRLMIALTITAGALAVALVGALIVAITTGAFS